MAKKPESAGTRTRKIAEEVASQMKRIGNQPIQSRIQELDAISRQNPGLLSD